MRPRRAVLAALLERGFDVKALDLSEDSWTEPRAHGRARAESGLPAARPGLELAYGDTSPRPLQSFSHLCIVYIANN